MRRLLVIAYHYPPLVGSSGIERTLRFVQHLPALGWECHVLATTLGALPRVAHDAGRDPLVSSVRVSRAFAVDAARTFSVAGRYPELLALPDRWSSWIPCGIHVGKNLIRNGRFDAIFSTFPIATAHVIAKSLAKSSGLPWIADFRDPLVQDAYPESARQRKVYKRLFDECVEQASQLVFATPSAALDARQKTTKADSSKFFVVENGYEESLFEDFPQWRSTALGDIQKFVLLHAGTVYLSERDPKPLFAALAALLKSKVISPENFELRLRASGNVAAIESLAEQYGVSSILSMPEPLPYVEALREMATVSALLILQAPNCNAQVPAKLYEYLRVGAPIFLLTDPAGDTARVAKDVGIPCSPDYFDVDRIASQLRAMLLALRQGDGAKYVGDHAKIRTMSRQSRTQELVGVLNRAVMTRDDRVS